LTGAVATAVAGWAHLYNDTKAVNVAVTYAHFAGMLVGGGFAVVADRDAFHLSPGALAAAPSERRKLAQVHTWVVGGLAVVFLSGLLMMLADLNTYLTSVSFWIKMALVLLLLANGYARIRAERALGSEAGAAWTWLRRTSAVSLALWLAVLLVSIILTAS
jgi:hypothetical protein